MTDLYTQLIEIGSQFPASKAPNIWKYWVLVMEKYDVMTFNYKKQALQDLHIMIEIYRAERNMQSETTDTNET